MTLSKFTEEEEPIYAAQRILNNLCHIKTKSLSEQIGMALEQFCKASGYFLLPCPEWKIQSKGYERSEIRNLILRYGSFLAYQIKCFNFYKNRPDDVLKFFHEEYIAEETKKMMLWVFDSTYKEFEDKRRMSKEQVINARRNAIDRYNRTFREQTATGCSVYFADQLKAM